MKFEWYDDYIRLYRYLNLHVNTHYTQSRNADVVNINNLRI